MSNPMKSSECIYPECGPTCRKNCPPLPTKPEPIEPTEEQWKTVFDVIDGNWMDGPSEVMRQVARLLAEREAKLRGEVYAQAWNLGGISVLATSRTPQDYNQTMARPALNEVAALLKDYDTLRAELHTERTIAVMALVARNAIENERNAARRDLARANGYLLAGQKSEMAMKGQLADARARVAELEADVKAAAGELLVEIPEPVIKARLWCQQCGLVGRSHTIGRTHAFRIRHVVREGYTRDDLVRVGEEVLKEYGGFFKDARKSASAVVDRLTKGDV